MRTLSNLTDQQLIQLFISGDTAALEGLINRHKDRIFTSIVILVKDKNLAEDIFQEVFIKIIDTLRFGSYTDEGKFLPLALRIAHNLCVDHFRKAKRTLWFTTNVKSMTCLRTLSLQKRVLKAGS